MGASAEDSPLVDDDAQEDPASQSARGAAIRAEREAADMTLVDVAEVTGLSRQTIARAEEGHASKSTYRTLENFFKNEISGPATPSAGLIEFEVSGDFGVKVVVRGPITDADALERSVARIVERIRAERATAQD